MFFFLKQPDYTVNLFQSFGEETIFMNERASSISSKVALDIPLPPKFMILFHFELFPQDRVSFIVLRGGLSSVFFGQYLKLSVVIEPLRASKLDLLSCYQLQSDRCYGWFAMLVWTL